MDVHVVSYALQFLAGGVWSDLDNSLIALLTLALIWPLFWAQRAWLQQ